MTLVYDAAWKGDAPITGGPAEDQDLESSLGHWPRMLNLDEDVEDRLRMWLDDEISRFFRERQPLLEQWEDEQALYWAEPESTEKNFPFKRAANIVIPLAAIAIETVHARMMNTLFSVEPFWSIRPRSAEWIPAAKPFENYLQTEVENGHTLRVYEFCSESLLELLKLGTAVGKSGYKREIKKSLKVVGDVEEEVYYEAYNGASLEHVPLANFMMRLAEKDPEVAAWVGEKHEITWGQLKKMAQSGRMDPEGVEAIRSYWQDVQSSTEEDGESLSRKVESLANAEPLWFEKYQFYEIWCAFDVDDDGWDEEIVIDYHRQSGTFLSVRYNWYDDLHRPYKYANYLEVEGIWPGIGICKQVKQFQEEATTIHRQRLDNATLANMAQVVIRKNSGYGPGEPIFPGKMWFMDDVQDIREFKLSEIYPSSYNNEESVVRYYEKRSGVNEVILGLPQQGTPGTATSDLTRLAEGNKRFDLVLRNVKRWMSLLGQDIITNYQLFGNQQVHWMIQGEDAGWTEQVLQMPSVLIRRGAVVDLTVTDSITNREVEQRQWLQLFQVLTNYYDRVLQIAQMMGDPQILQPIAQRALLGSDEAMRRMLETFTITDSDRFTLTEETPSAGNGPPSGPTEGPANRLAGISGEAGVEGAETGFGGNGSEPTPLGPGGA